MTFNRRGGGSRFSWVAGVTVLAVGGEAVPGASLLALYTKDRSAAQEFSAPKTLLASLEYL